MPSIQDQHAPEAAAASNDPAIRSLLEQVCGATSMGFAALARVTDRRWIACQVVDRIGLGLDAETELDVKTTICADIRETGRRVVIDEVATDPEWRTHPIPALYGFESYASLPLVLDDGSFFGTLCVMDDAPRALSAPDTVAALQGFARRLAALLSAPRTVLPGDAG